jgi:rubrerythrin
MKAKQFKELLLQSLEHERGGVKIYEKALECALDEDLKEELERYRNETEKHVAVLQNLFAQLGLDAEEESPGRDVVRYLGASLVKAMDRALDDGKAEAAQLIACECVVLAETKDHLDWDLIGEAAKKLTGADGKAVKEAYAEIEDEEDEHLYHSKGWCRELWLDSLGLKAVLPPPEEKRHVRTAIGAARAERARSKMR